MYFPYLEHEEHIHVYMVIGESFIKCELIVAYALISGEMLDSTLEQFSYSSDTLLSNLKTILKEGYSLNLILGNGFKEVPKKLLSSVT